MVHDLQSDHFLRARERMVELQLRQRGIRDERVLAAMERVPRHQFVSEEACSEAYEDHPLMIGCSQTISQPYIVALMLEYLEISSNDTVLEVGTGSGYQAALLGELATHVYTLERHSALAESARNLLHRLGYENITVLNRDGSEGLPGRAPFSGIIVSAAAQAVPPALFEQLTEAGRIIIPVGGEYAQELQLVRKHDGQPLVTTLEGCRFVPLLPGTSSE